MDVLELINETANATKLKIKGQILYSFYDEIRTNLSIGKTQGDISFYFEKNTEELDLAKQAVKELEKENSNFEKYCTAYNVDETYHELEISYNLQRNMFV